VIAIAEHIERLLRVNDCVIIPDFGGFVLQERPAAHDREKHQFTPAHKEIAFNPTLKHDDGLLADAYMQSLGTTFNNARETLRQDVDNLKNTLNETGVLVLQNIGSFHKNIEDRLVFTPDDDRLRYSLTTYGLDTFNMPSVLSDDDADVVENKHKNRKPARVFYLPVNRVAAYIAGISVAAVVLSLIITTPVTEVNSSSFTASFAPAEIVKRISQETDAEAETGDSVTVTVTEEMPTEQVVETTPEPTAKVEMPVTDSSRKYYVIIGSFVTERQAHTFIDNVAAPVNENIGIVQRDSRIRVYADRFANRAAAMEYIAVLRKNAKYKDAWLFIDR